MAFKWYKILEKYLAISTIFSICCIFFIFQHLHSKEVKYRYEFNEKLEGPLEADDLKVIDLIRTKYMNKPSSEPYNLSENEAYKLSKNYYSWPYIHSFTKRLFQNQTRGFFIEAGALDGEYLSNSLWLEKELNWTGLLVEPDPSNYQEILKKNRKAWTSNTCLSSKPYPKQTIMVSRRRTTHSGSSWYTWVYRGSSHEIGYTLPPSYDSLFAATTPTYIRVQCFPLYSYLLALNRTKIDLFSLDIQGPEMEVIQTIPFDKIQVRAFVIEHIATKTYDKDFIQYFEKRGYILIGCGGEPDYIFILKEEFSEQNFKEVTHCKQE